MRGPKPPEVRLSEEERKELEILVKANKTAQQIAFRAKIIITLADGYNAVDTAKFLETTKKTVKLWRRHWFEGKELTVIEKLQDRERSGAPVRIRAEQWCQIMALACEPPELSGRPISHWTPRELADEAIKRKIVESISTRHVGRFLKSGRAKATQKPILAQCKTR